MDHDQIGGIIVEAVHEVFESLACVPPKQEPTELVATPMLEGELISAAHISGEMRGIVAMVCSRKAGEALALSMLGMPGGSLGADVVADSIGEIVNMVSGHIKTRFVDEGVDFRLSIPVVASAADLTVGFPAELNATKVDFRVDGGKVSFMFMVEKGRGA